MFDFLFRGLIKRKTLSSETIEKVTREWQNIDLLVSQGGPSQLRQALIAADKTLDNVLRDISDGEKMSERLIAAENRFSKTLYNKIWSAHKLRNNLVHESGFEPPYHVLEAAIADLKEAVGVLGVNI